MDGLRWPTAVTAASLGDRDGCWTVDFYDFTVVSAPLDGELAGLADVAERARRNGAWQGTPVVMHTAGRVDSRVNAFFRSGPMTTARPATWRR
ncbi:MAG: hypothetical protein ACRD0U_11970 [Acidimicrobiales bacterium]